MVDHWRCVTSRTSITAAEFPELGLAQPANRADYCRSEFPELGLAQPANRADYCRSVVMVSLAVGITLCVIRGMSNNHGESGSEGSNSNTSAAGITRRLDAGLCQSPAAGDPRWRTGVVTTELGARGRQPRGLPAPARRTFAAAPGRSGRRSAGHLLRGHRLRDRRSRIPLGGFDHHGTRTTGRHRNFAMGNRCERSGAVGVGVQVIARWPSGRGW